MTKSAKMASDLITKAIDEGAWLEVSNQSYNVSARKITFKMVEEVIYVWLQEKHDPSRGSKGPVIELYCGGEAHKAANHFIKYSGIKSSIGVALKYFRSR